MTYQFRDLYEHQLAVLAEKDHIRLIDENYTDDAELRTYDVHVVGADALKTYFQGYIANLGYLKLISTDKYVESSDAIMFEATMETARGIARVYDVFIVRDGKIARHFAGLLGFTPHAPSA